jgi:hypothetical protein
MRLKTVFGITKKYHYIVSTTEWIKLVSKKTKRDLIMKKKLSFYTDVSNQASYTM